MSSIRFRMAAAGLASVAILSLACGSEDVLTPTPGGSGTPTPVGGQPIISGYDAVYFGLRGAGGQVEKGDEIKQSFFAVPGRVIKVNGKDVQVFEYRSVTAAEAAAGRISPDGFEIRSEDGAVAMVDWIAPPHFYRQANTIVLYVGDDSTVLGVLGKALGDPFAGSGKASEQPATQRVPAPIDEVQVLVLESAPVQYRLLVKSGLPSSCARFEGYEVQREGDTVRVTVSNRVPTGAVMCAQVYGTVESSIAIGNGNDFQSGRLITVLVNDKKTTFVAQ